MHCARVQVLQFVDALCARESVTKVKDIDDEDLGDGGGRHENLGEGKVFGFRV